MSEIARYVQTDDFKNEKHVPVIEVLQAPGKQQAAQIRVSVGKQIGHPNTSEHFIVWISLYFKPKDGKFIYHLGRAQFDAHGASTQGPNTLGVHTDPVAHFQVVLDLPGTLHAVSYCNIHGLWESWQEI